MNNTKEFITINSRKYNGEVHRSWKAELINTENSLLILVGEFEKEIRHDHLGVIRRGTISYEYYWLDKWYNVFRFHEPSGELRNFYCNVNIPPVLNDKSLDYVDLDIDILIWQDFSMKILDQEEFAENSKKFSYPTELIDKTNESFNELVSLIKNRKFPFDYRSC